MRYLIFAIELDWIRLVTLIDLDGILRTLNLRIYLTFNFPFHTISKIKIVEYFVKVMKNTIIKFSLFFMSLLYLHTIICNL